LKKHISRNCTKTVKHLTKNTVFSRILSKDTKIELNSLWLYLQKEELYPIKSMHFEALKGDKQGKFSVRVNKQYRIEFTLNENLKQPILTICNIVELSNHYD
jgi:proteic killer suppression protein